MDSYHYGIPLNPSENDPSTTTLSPKPGLLKTKNPLDSLPSLCKESLLQRVLLPQTLPGCMEVHGKANEMCPKKGGFKVKVMASTMKGIKYTLKEYINLFYSGIQADSY